MFSAAFVCLFVNTITSERLNVARLKFPVRCIVRKYHPSSNLGGHRSKVKVTRDKKNEKVRHFFDRGPRGRELCRPPVLLRWENQRMLSSCHLRLILRKCDVGA